MVRTYKTKTEKGVRYRYCKEDLQQAIDDIKNGNKSIREANIAYISPRTNIKHNINETKEKGNRQVVFSLTLPNKTNWNYQNASE